MRHVITAPSRLEIAELRLEAALDATGFALPACRALIGTQLTASDSHAEVVAIVKPAFAELKPLLARAGEASS